MANVKGVWDAKDKKDEKNKKNEMFTSQGGQSAQGVLRPIKNADPELIEELLKNAQQQVNNKKPPPKNLGKNIILYKNGFKLGEDGEFRDISDAKNKEFLEEIKQGAIPYELQQQLKEELGEQILGNEEVGVGLINKSNEEYVPEKPKFEAFKGEGYSLKNNNNNNDNKNEEDENKKQPFADAKPKQFDFNDKEESIVVQLILYNGEKHKLKINAKTTVFELYCHVQYLSKKESSFDMLAGFPPKVLDNPDQTVKEAGLNGSKVTQKLH